VRLLRDLVEHEAWYLPVTNQSVAGLQPGDNVSPAIRFSRDKSDGKVLCIFSNMTTFNTYQDRLASPTGPDAALEAERTWIFGRVLDDFASVIIDPYSPCELSCERQQFKLLNDTAADYEQMMARFPGTYSHEQHTGLSIAEGVIDSNFQGLVFNPSGHVATVAFAARFAHLVKGAR
jgi:hypothetical protein